MVSCEKQTDGGVDSWLGHCVFYVLKSAMMPGSFLFGGLYPSIHISFFLRGYSPGSKKGVITVILLLQQCCVFCEPTAWCAAGA